MPDYLSPDDDEEQERQEIEQVAPSALAVLNRSEHAAMVQTANLPGNKRKLAEFDSKLMAYANHSQPVALSMFYSLPRAGKQLIGASVRFAEIVAPCWRNCAVAARVIGDSPNTVTAQGIFLDYEANLRNAIEVPRRITDKNGNRFADDMIITTSNAAMSVARRNAVLKGGVPQALWTPAYEAAQLTAVGKAASHSQRVADAMDFLHKMGLTEWQILNAVAVPSVKELETEHLVILRVLCQEIKRGDKTIEQVFGSEHDKEIDSLFDQLKKNQAQRTALRQAYMGRAGDLVDYLRERLGAVAQRPVVPASSPKAEPPAQTKLDDKTESPAIPETPQTAEADSPRIEAATALREQDQVKERTITVPTLDGGTSQATVVSGERRPQTSMEPDRPRGRGRPTREEMARRRAAEQGMFEPQQSEEDARGEVEDIVGQADKFAF